MKGSAAARRYARALFGLAREESRVEVIRAELCGLSDLITQTSELRVVLLTPLYPARERKGVMNGLSARLNLSKSVRHFFAFLIDQRRLLDVAGVRDEYERLADEATGVVTAEVTAAAPLDERRRERLQRALSHHTGQQVLLDVSIDPSLIGGAIAKVGDLVFDGSVRAQLARLRSSLAKEA
jgi:F-type H+-transporting ATPase subunit delta